jgi:lysophospholipase L1-like esterase
MERASGAFIPFSNLSRAGDSTPGYSNGTAVTRTAMFEFGTHAIFGMGNNDPANGFSLASIQANYTAIWAHARAHGLFIAQATMPPRTTSSNSWSSAAGQTVVSGYGASETRGQLNAWFSTALASGLIDQIIDLNSACEDPANPGKWVTNGSANYATTDGIHPSTAMHQLMGNVGRSATDTWTI